MPIAQPISEPVKMIRPAFALYSRHARPLLLYSILKYIVLIIGATTVIATHFLAGDLVRQQSDMFKVIYLLASLTAITLIQYWYGYYYELRYSFILFDIVEDKLKNPSLKNMINRLKSTDESMHKYRKLSSKYRSNSITVFFKNIRKPIAAFGSDGYIFNKLQRNNFAVEAYPYWLYNHPDTTLKPQDIPFSEKDNDEINRYINRSAVMFFTIPLLIVLILILYIPTIFIVFPYLSSTAPYSGPLDLRLLNFLDMDSIEHINDLRLLLLYRIAILGVASLVLHPLISCIHYFRVKYIIHRFYMQAHN
jgi:hypothetical protein